MTHIQWTSLGFKDLESLPQWLAFEVIRRTDLLGQFPEMGALLETTHAVLEGLRQIIINRKIRVIYDFDKYENKVYILCVQNCRQKLPSMRDLQRRKKET